MEYLDEFHQKYVLVPADKAGNNIIVVCKKYYVEVVIRELVNNDQPSTYVDVDDNRMQLVNANVNDLRLWNIDIKQDMKQLPTLYWFS